MKTRLFFDIKIKIDFLLNKNLTNNLVFEKTDNERFIPIALKIKILDRLKIDKRKSSKKSKKKTLNLSNVTKQTLLKLTDIQGEKLLKKNL